MRRKLLTCAFAGLAVVLPARATDANALAISSNIQATHVPFGTVLDPSLPDRRATRSSAIPLRRFGHLDGHYLAAEAFRYQVTQSPAALANVKQAIAESSRCWT